MVQHNEADSLHPGDPTMIAIAAKDFAENPNKSASYFRVVNATVARMMAAIHSDIMATVEKDKAERTKK